MNTGRTDDANSHYFSEKPQANSAEREYRFEVDDTPIRIVSDRGVFSMNSLDKGTAALLHHLSVDEASLPPGDIVDVGCGAGPLAIALAHHFPTRQVWGVDVNSRALELTERNARLNNVSNVKTSTPENFPDVHVAAIWSNPPIRIGKPALHELLLVWLRRLEPHGICRLVINKNLGGDSLQKWLVSEGFECERIGSKSGFRILEVSHP